MVNMIIATNNFNHAKNMFNSITEMDKNIRIIGISSNKKETIERLKNQSPDILILDFEISERNMIEIQHMLNKQREKEINTKIIIISKNIEKLKKVYGYNEKICYFIDRTYNNDNISKLIIEKSINIEHWHIKEFISKELEKFQFNKPTNSYKYLNDAIFIVICSGKLDFELEKNIYKKVAQINKKKNELVIKWGIEKLVEQMYINTRYCVIQDYFDFTEDKKPTTKLLIRTVTEKYYNTLNI